jgi:hypothetical protein
MGLILLHRRPLSLLQPMHHLYRQALREPNLSHNWGRGAGEF